MAEVVKRNKNASRDGGCLGHPGYECNCPLKDLVRRKEILLQTRQRIGAYSTINLLDPGLAQTYETERRKLCEGIGPSSWQKLIDGTLFR